MNQEFVRASRRRDLLLTLVMVCIGLTPAWLTPSWLSVPWLVIGLILGVPAVYYSWNYAPWVPTSREEVPRIIKLLELEEHQTFCDLGAGDGRLVIAVHNATGARCTGIEVSPMQYLVGRLRLMIQGGAETTLVLGDLHDADLSSFDALYVWGTAYWVCTPEFTENLVKKLRPGARLLSYHWPLSGLDPVHVDEEGQRPIHVYVVPMET